MPKLQMLLIWFNSSHFGVSASSRGSDWRPMLRPWTAVGVLIWDCPRAPSKHGVPSAGHHPPGWTSPPGCSHMQPELFPPLVMPASQFAWCVHPWSSLDTLAPSRPHVLTIARSCRSSGLCPLSSVPPPPPRSLHSCLPAHGAFWSACLTLASTCLSG